MAPNTGMTFDARPLTDPVDQAALKAFSKEQVKTGSSTISVATVVVLCIVLAMFGIFILPLVIIPVFLQLGSANAGFSLVGLIPVVAFIAIIGGAVALAITSSRTAKTRAYRLSRFAAANGMEFVGQIVDPPLPGMIFHSGRAKRTTMALRGRTPRFVEFGNYQFTTGSGKNSRTHHWGYIAVKLDVPLPNIVLDALGNNTLGTNLPASFDKDQRLSLEGDFNEYFSLYCPEGYERDALYLFTPDIMARFIDHAAELDVEIVDDWMFLYLKGRQASTTDPATWAWLFGVVAALMTKFDQWARWRDERLAAASAAPASATPAPGAAAPPALPFAPPAGMITPPPGVAAPGRRLKRSFSWVTIVIAVLIGVFWLLPQLIGTVLRIVD